MTPDKLAQRRVAAARRAKDKRMAKQRQRAQHAASQEKRDEIAAPAQQRNPVLDPAGNVTKSARLTRDGVGFKPASPIDALALTRRWITPAHCRAVKRLEHCWRSVGDGIGTGSAMYSSLGASHGGIAPSSPPGHAVLCAQLDAQKELHALASALGPLYVVIRDVCFIGLDLSAWAQRRGIDRKAVTGYLCAALDHVEALYEAIDDARKPRQEMRSAAFAA